VSHAYVLVNGHLVIRADCEFCVCRHADVLVNGHLVIRADCVLCVSSCGRAC
jgi:hypothetical protein